MLRVTKLSPQAGQSERSEVSAIVFRRRLPARVGVDPEHDRIMRCHLAPGRVAHQPAAKAALRGNRGCFEETGEQAHLVAPTSDRLAAPRTVIALTCVLEVGKPGNCVR